MPDTNNKPAQVTPAAPEKTADKPDDTQYVTLARPQAHAIFTEQRVDFKGDEVKQVVGKREPTDRGTTILTDAAKELVKAGQLVYCNKNGKPLEAEKDAK